MVQARLAKRSSETLSKPLVFRQCHLGFLAGEGFRGSKLLLTISSSEKGLPWRFREGL